MVYHTLLIGSLKLLEVANEVDTIKAWKKSESAMSILMVGLVGSSGSV